MSKILLCAVLILLTTGCASLQQHNPYANYIINTIEKEGGGCFDVTIKKDGENVTVENCFTKEQRLQLYHDQRYWTRTERALAWTAIVCQVGDVITTKLILDDGGSEKNPVYGSNPNVGVIAVVKTIITLGALVVADAKPLDRKALLLGFDAASCAVLAWNANQL